MLLTVPRRRRKQGDASNSDESDKGEEGEESEEGGDGEKGDEGEGTVARARKDATEQSRYVELLYFDFCRFLLDF